jgi:hypothetical protein
MPAHWPRKGAGCHYRADPCAVRAQRSHAMTSTTSAPMVTVTSGRDVLGFIIARGPRGYEAYSPDEVSLGLYPSRVEAADAISAAAPGQAAETSPARRLETRRSKGPEK